MPLIPRGNASLIRREIPRPNAASLKSRELFAAPVRLKNKDYSLILLVATAITATVTAAVIAAARTAIAAVAAAITFAATTIA